MTVTSWAPGRVAAVAGEILIGASSDITATNLKDAINYTGTPGTQYIAPASAPYAHPILSATVTNSVLTLTDQLACARSTGWANTPGTGFLVTTPAGGANGTLVAKLVPPNTTVAGSFAVSNVDLSAAPYFPPGATWISDWVAMSGMEKATGATFYVMLQGDYTGTPWNVVLRYNLGASGNLAAFTGTATTTVAINSTAVQYAFLQVPEAAESLKLFIDNTAGTARGVRIFAGLVTNK